MARNPSNINFETQDSMKSANLFKYLQRSTNEILSVLDGVDDELNSRKRIEKHDHLNNQRCIDPYNRDMRELSHHYIEQNQKLRTKVDQAESKFNVIPRHGNWSTIALTEGSPAKEMYRNGDSTDLNGTRRLENYYHQTNQRFTELDKMDMREQTHSAVEQNQEVNTYVDRVESMFNEVLRHSKRSTIALTEKPLTKDEFRFNESQKLSSVEGEVEEAFQVGNSASKTNFEGPCSYIDFSPNQPEVKWHQGLPDFILQNATKIGFTKTGTSLYAGRTWNTERSFLVPGYVNFDEGKCYFGKDGKLWSSNTFEVMESKSIAWHDTKGSPVTELPRYAYKAGYNEQDEPLYFGRAFIDGAFSPGYIKEIAYSRAPNRRAFALIVPFRKNILRIFDTYEVMVILPSIKL